jgi:hypothetical protein
LVAWARKYGVPQQVIDKDLLEIGNLTSDKYPETKSKTKGINIAGYLQGELGVGQSARLILKSAEATRLPIYVLNSNIFYDPDEVENYYYNLAVLLYILESSDEVSENNNFGINLYDELGNTIINFLLQKILYLCEYDNKSNKLPVEIAQALSALAVVGIYGISRLVSLQSTADKLVNLTIRLPVEKVDKSAILSL